MAERDARERATISTGDLSEFTAARPFLTLLNSLFARGRGARNQI
jgi:hypothetical protein